MKFTIIVSKQDKAGLNIAKILIDKYGFEESVETFDGSKVYIKNQYELVFGAKDIIFIDYVQRKSEVYIFASRHKSESGYPCLTVHPTGNFANDVSHGGRPRELCPTHSFLMKKALILLKELAERRKIPYSVSYEVTHHGPTNMKKPSFFIEVGSKEENWNDLRACECIADVIMQLNEYHLKEVESCIGFGGPHYAPIFTKKALLTNYALGHMCPKYSADFLDFDLIKQMIEKTFPIPKYALIDWKGLRGKQRSKIISQLEKLNIEVIKV